MRRRLLLLLVAVVAFSLLTAYFLTANRPPEEETEVTLTIPSKIIYYLWPYVGREVGIFSEEGISLEIILPFPASVGVQALIEGSAHFSAISESGVTAMLKGADLKIIGYTNKDVGYDLYSQPEIANIADLKGKTVAVIRVPSVDTTIIKEMLRLHGLNPDTDVTLVGIGLGAERLAALQSRQVDASVFLPPETIIAEENGFNMLETSYTTPGKLIGLLLTNQQMIDKKPDTVKGMVRGMVRSIKYVLDHPEEAIQIAMTLFDMDQESATETYYAVVSDFAYTVPLEDVVLQFEVVNSFFDEPVEFDVQTWLDHTFLNEVLEELGQEPMTED
jgi:NitT/TauT family transport system substrate-binding protein